MGRSVSYPADCIAVAFQTFESDDEYEWIFFLEDIQRVASSAWKSLEDCDLWLGREDHVVLENQHCYIGVSEYCGIVAVWLKARDDNEHPGLSEAWCSRIRERFLKTFGTIHCVGRFSNGEAVYERIEEEVAA